MDRDRRTSDDLLRRSALDYFFGRRPHEEVGHGGPHPQRTPANVYDAGDDIVVVTPMPGVEADDIDIQIHGRRVTLRATLRGPHQVDRRYLLHEWTYGPYICELELPVDIDAERANASHGNGVLAVTLPKASSARTVRINLQQTGAASSAHQGHAGRSNDEGRS